MNALVYWVLIQRFVGCERTTTASLRRVVTVAALPTPPPSPLRRSADAAFAPMQRNIVTPSCTAI